MKRSLLLALLGAPLLMTARPADPQPITVTNPDGTTLQVRAHGDEYFHFTTDLDNNYILETNDKGFWVNAKIDGRPLRCVPEDIEALESKKLSGVARRARTAATQHRMAALTNEGRTTYPTVSDEQIPALVVLVQFADTKFSVDDPVKAFDRKLNEEGYSAYNSVGSARDYYVKNSNGKFNVHFDVAPIVTLSKGRTFYNGLDDDPSGDHRNTHFKELFMEMIEQLDPQVDFSKYDIDKDGTIDNIFFFYAGHGMADTLDPTCIWPHQGDYLEHVRFYGAPNLTPDGVQVRTYACSNELIGRVPSGEQQPYLDGIGAFCHEYGHVLGFPDLYDTKDTGSKTPGAYDLMDQGSYNLNSTCPPALSAYERWVCHWLEIEDIHPDSNGTFTLPSMSVSNDPKAYRILVPRPGLSTMYNEGFYIETRHNEGWDRTLPEEGLFIWRVNYVRKTWTDNTVNVNRDLHVEMINSLFDSRTPTFAFPGKNHVSYAIPGYDSELKFANTNAIWKPWITGIAYDAEKHEASFGYNVCKELPSDVTVMRQPELISADERRFKLSWDAAEGATGYMVTVVRVSSTGRESIVDGYEDKNVGNVTECSVGNITKSVWKQNFKAYVRVVNQAPSSEISNTIEFVPESLENGTGVDGVAEESVVIYGTVGAVVAPADAVVYNLSGMSVGRENLPAGIYLVSYNGNVTKVVVK